MITYDTPLKGQTHIKNAREQIQVEIDQCLESNGLGIKRHKIADELYQIVVDNFKNLEK